MQNNSLTFTYTVQAGMAFKWVLVKSGLMRISVGVLVKANTLIPNRKTETG